MRALLIAAIGTSSTAIWAQEGADRTPPAGPAKEPGVEELVKRGNQARREGHVHDAIASYSKARDLAPHT